MSDRTRKNVDAALFGLLLGAILWEVGLLPTLLEGIIAPFVGG